MDERALRDSPPWAGPSAQALDALQAVLLELVGLALDHGLQMGQFEELVKRAMVSRAMRTVRGADDDGDVPVSRLSVMTGIHRKEVKRVLESFDDKRIRFRPSPVTQVFARWTNDPVWQDRSGRPLVLPRRIDRDDVLSFEKLARSVTTDVHPKSLLDELLRLALVTHDPQHDTVALRTLEPVPGAELELLIASAAGSIADHVAAARENIAAFRSAARIEGAVAPFLEQSIVADELSAQAAHDATLRANEVWRDVVRAIVPALLDAEAADRQAGRRGTHRLRLGVFCYAEAMTEPMPPRAASAGGQADGEVGGEVGG